MKPEQEEVKRVNRMAERRAMRPERIDPTQLYSLEETCAALDIGRSTLYRLMEEARIKPLAGLDSKRLRFAGSEIMRVVADLSAPKSAELKRAK